MAYWFNTANGQVETDDTRGPDSDVMGPYATQEEASRALATARENTERWDAQDRADDDFGFDTKGSDAQG